MFDGKGGKLFKDMDVPRELGPVRVHHEANGDGITLREEVVVEPGAVDAEDAPVLSR